MAQKKEKLQSIAIIRAFSITLVAYIMPMA